MPDVELVPIDAGNWRACLAVRVLDEQLRFVADHQPIALVILAKSYVGVDNRSWDPLAVRVDDTIVGVLGLAHSDDDTHMVHLAIDHGSQRRGFARAAVQHAISRSAAPGSSQILLTVNVDNDPAQALYVSLGFSPTGKIIDHDPEWRREL